MHPATSTHGPPGALGVTHNQAEQWSPTAQVSTQHDPPTGTLSTGVRHTPSTHSAPSAPQRAIPSSQASPSFTYLTIWHVDALQIAPCAQMGR
jgi:hypothetical protein